MRTLSSIVILAMAVVGPAIAQPAPANEPTDRVTGLDYSCADLGALVARQGAVTVRTGPFGYDRLVRDQLFCERELITGPITVETRDNRTCFAGYRCRERYQGEGRNQ